MQRYSHKGCREDVMRMGILTVSDRCFDNYVENRKGKNNRTVVEERLRKKLVLNSLSAIKNNLEQWCGEKNVGFDFDD